MNEQEVSNQIAKAIADAMPTKEEILAAITLGIHKSFGLVWESQILNAIADGTKEAFESKRTKK